jgi:cell fate (sporulation/competence/biofilm development) regulator YlbF (YheA/YmcA/DUF963 family)
MDTTMLEQKQLFSKFHCDQEAVVREMQELERAIDALEITVGK